jgi:predicted RNA polymerase sigma factor
VALYDALLAVHPSPVARLSRAMALAMAAGSLKGFAYVLAGVLPSF